MITITPPSSKSVAHRALIAASINGGIIRNITYSSDVLATIDCLKQLGVRFNIVGSTVTVTRCIDRKIRTATLYCNESGSTLRFFIPIVAALNITTVFTGKESLMQRPMTPILDLLNTVGCIATQTDGKIEVSGKINKNIFSIAGDISSQFITGLIFAASLLNIDSQIILTTAQQSKGYLDLTITVLSDFGIDIKNNNSTFDIKGSQHYRNITYTVESDFSAAAFFLVASAIYKPIAVNGLNLASAQGDKEIIDILRKVGCIVNTCGDIVVLKNELKATDIDVSQIPDLVPILAVLLSFCNGKSKIYNAARVRLKESDRLMAITTELNAIGGKITQGNDYLIIESVHRLNGGNCSSHNDHRIAMALAIASLCCDNTVMLDNKLCVAKSYPNFFSDLKLLTDTI